MVGSHHGGGGRGGWVDEDWMAEESAEGRGKNRDRKERRKKREMLAQSIDAEDNDRRPPPAAVATNGGSDVVPGGYRHYGREPVVGCIEDDSGVSVSHNNNNKDGSDIDSRHHQEKRDDVVRGDRGGDTTARDRCDRRDTRGSKDNTTSHHHYQQTSRRNKGGDVDDDISSRREQRHSREQRLCCYTTEQQQRHRSDNLSVDTHDDRLRKISNVVERGDRGDRRTGARERGERGVYHHNGNGRHHGGGQSSHDRYDDSNRGYERREVIVDNGREDQTVLVGDDYHTTAMPRDRHSGGGSRYKCHIGGSVVRGGAAIDNTTSSSHEHLSVINSTLCEHVNALRSQTEATNRLTDAVTKGLSELLVGLRTLDQRLIRIETYAGIGGGGFGTKTRNGNSVVVNRSSTCDGGGRKSGEGGDNGRHEEDGSRPNCGDTRGDSGVGGTSWSRGVGDRRGGTTTVERSSVSSSAVSEEPTQPQLNHNNITHIPASDNSVNTTTTGTATTQQQQQQQKSSVRSNSSGGGAGTTTPSNCDGTKDLKKLISTVASGEMRVVVQGYSPPEAQEGTTTVGGDTGDVAFASLHIGELVKLGTVKHDWAFVFYGQNKSGWFPASFLEDAS
eukprot:GHVS01016087.1.p1 GENE.GHVS01016087.1~~GHVS01016087.1.p1  ORF type:complete len:616 (+),score=176.37 GHVS01016087.1:151-1998(+)